MLHVICTRLRSGHLRVRVGDGSRRSEETVKQISNCAFQCDDDDDEEDEEEEEEENLYRWVSRVSSKIGEG